MPPRPRPHATPQYPRPHRPSAPVPLPTARPPARTHAHTPTRPHGRTTARPHDRTTARYACAPALPLTTACLPCSPPPPPPPPPPAPLGLARVYSTQHGPQVCGARIKAPTALSLPPTTSAAPAAAAALESLCDQLRTSHGALCPWASNASPPMLGALLLPSRQHEGVPSLQQGQALAKQHLRGRLSGLLSLPSLPALAPSATEAVAACATLCGLQDEAALLSSIALLLDLPPRCYEGRDAERWLAATRLALLGWGPSADQISIWCVEDARTLRLDSWQQLGASSEIASAAPASLAFGAAAPAAPAAAPAAADTPLSVVSGAGQGLGGAALAATASGAAAPAAAAAAAAGGRGAGQQPKVPCAPRAARAPPHAGSPHHPSPPPPPLAPRPHPRPTPPPSTHALTPHPSPHLSPSLHPHPSPNTLIAAAARPGRRAPHLVAVARAH